MLVEAKSPLYFPCIQNPLVSSKILAVFERVMHASMQLFFTIKKMSWVPLAVKESLTQIVGSIFTRHQMTLKEISFYLPLDRRDCMDRVGKAFASSSLHLSRAYDLHRLHGDLTFVTDCVKKDSKAAHAWILHLAKIAGKEVCYPDGYKSTFDASMELARLYGNIPPICVEKLGDSSVSVLAQIYALERESFTRDSLLSFPDLKKILLSPQTACYVARRSGSQEILGVLWERREDPHFHICCVARKAGAAGLHIGERLMQVLLENHLEDSMFLEVDVNNKTAISLYKKMGFRVMGWRPNYYTHPDSDAWIMYRNRDQSA